MIQLVGTRERTPSNKKKKIDDGISSVCRKAGLSKLFQSLFGSSNIELLAQAIFQSHHHHH
jgi:hypothetical protein